MSLLLLFHGGEAVVVDTSFEPLVGMRYSDDLGHTWSHWQWRTLGSAGRYSDKARWNGLGTIKAPGRMFQIKSTDPTVIRFSKLLMNVKP